MKIKELRIKKGLTQKECAEKLDLGNVCYNRYEMGKREPDIETLKKIANYFNVSLDYLCENDKAKVLEFGTLTSSQQQAIDLLLTLNEQELNHIIGYIKGMKQNELTAEEKIKNLLQNLNT